LAASFQIIQDVLGKDNSLAAWDEEQTKAVLPVKSPKKLPQSRESLGIYPGTYVNPKTEGSKVYLNLRLVTTKAHQVPLAGFGVELTDQFASSKHRMAIQRQASTCQAAQSECIGWLMYSCRSMNSNTFIPAIKKALNIPDTVAIGIQFRSIAHENGKNPPSTKKTHLQLPYISIWFCLGISSTVCILVAEELEATPSQWRTTPTGSMFYVSNQQIHDRHRAIRRKNPPQTSVLLRQGAPAHPPSLLFHLAIGYTSFQG
jgi:hypothetical protein